MPHKKIETLRTKRNFARYSSKTQALSLLNTTDPTTGDPTTTSGDTTNTLTLTTTGIFRK